MKKSKTLNVCNYNEGKIKESIKEAYEIYYKKWNIDNSDKVCKEFDRIKEDINAHYPIVECYSTDHNNALPSGQYYIIGLTEDISSKKISIDASSNDTFLMIDGKKYEGNRDKIPIDEYVFDRIINQMKYLDKIYGTLDYKNRLKENSAKIERAIWETEMPKIKNKYKIQKVLLLQEQEKEKIKKTISEMLKLLYLSKSPFQNTLIDIYNIAKNHGCTKEDIKNLCENDGWKKHCDRMK